jgi:hypothetical protein
VIVFFIFPHSLSFGMQIMYIELCNNINSFIIINCDIDLCIMYYNLYCVVNLS